MASNQINAPAGKCRFWKGFLACSMRITGVHGFDLARWLIGSEIERGFSEGGCLVYPELGEVGDTDNAVIHLKFENGAVSNIDVSRNAVYDYDIRSESLGSEGGLLIGMLQETPTSVAATLFLDEARPICLSELK